MFDIGFWELTLIAVIALLVIGPDRLPAVARSSGLLFGRLRRFVLSVKADIDRELSLEEVRKYADAAENSQLHEIIEQTDKDVKEGISAPDDEPAQGKPGNDQQG